MSKFKWMIVGMLFAAIFAAMMVYLKKTDDYWNGEDILND